jgi:hypothetical protein
MTVASFVADMKGFQLVMNFLECRRSFCPARFSLTNYSPTAIGGVDGMRTLHIDAPHFGTATDGSRSQQRFSVSAATALQTRTPTLSHSSGLLL